MPAEKKTAGPRGTVEIPAPSEDHLKLDLYKYWCTLGLDQMATLPAVGSLLGNAAAVMTRAAAAEAQVKLLQAQLRDLKATTHRYLRNSKEDRDLLEAMVQ